MRKIFVCISVVVILLLTYIVLAKYEPSVDYQWHIGAKGQPIWSLRSDVQPMMLTLEDIPIDIQAMLKRAYELNNIGVVWRYLNKHTVQEYVYYKDEYMLFIRLKTDKRLEP